MPDRTGRTPMNPAITFGLGMIAGTLLNGLILLWLSNTSRKR